MNQGEKEQVQRLLDKVQRMRDWQRRYFAERTVVTLIEAKKAEEEVDAEVKALRDYLAGEKIVQHTIWG